MGNVKNRLRYCLFSLKFCRGNFACHSVLSKCLVSATVQEGHREIV